MVIYFIENTLHTKNHPFWALSQNYKYCIKFLFLKILMVCFLLNFIFIFCIDTLSILRVEYVEITDISFVPFK